MVEAGFVPEERPPADPAVRLRHQEQDGVDAEVIYGILTLQLYLKDPAVAEATFLAYNDFIAEFCEAAPDRFIGLGCLPCHDAKAAARELKRIGRSGLGLRGAEFSTMHAAKPVWDRYWEPLWEAAEENDVVISLHSRIGTSMLDPFSGDPVAFAAAICVMPMQMDEVLSALIFCGVLERHPGLKVVIAETGIGWIPYVLDRMDYEFEEYYHEKFSKLIQTRPSDLFRRQMYATFQQDYVGPLLAERFAPDSFLWGSDYPHPDGIWPDSQAIIEKTMGHLDPALRQKIVHDNCARLYGIA